MLYEFLVVIVGRHKDVPITQIREVIGEKALGKIP